MNDSDIEMAELQSAANHESKLHRAGICAHGWLQGTPGEEGPCTCLYCGKVFATNQDAYDERREILI